MILERGLDLNVGCHPDPGQYDYEEEAYGGGEKYGDAGGGSGVGGGFNSMYQNYGAAGDDDDDIGGPFGGCGGNIAAQKEGEDGQNRQTPQHSHGDGIDSHIVHTFQDP